MIRISPTAYPQTEVFAVCDVCGKEVARETFDTYFNQKRVQAKLRKQYRTCPFCEERSRTEEGKAVMLKWQKHLDIYGRVTKDWEAKAPEGDFLVWRQGKLWRARWRAYGSEKRR